MKKKKTKVESPYENVRVSRNIVELVREYKKETYMPIGKFFELAAEEKLKRDTK